MALGPRGRRWLRRAGARRRGGRAARAAGRAEQLQRCLEKLAQSDLPNLWKPRADQFFRLDALPYLGTGKLDLRKARELAVRVSSTRA